MIEKPRELITSIYHEFYWSNSIVPMINKKYVEIRSNFNTKVKRIYISGLRIYLIRSSNLYCVY